MPTSYTPFFKSNTFISNARLKLTKNKAKGKKHLEAELLIFENYSLSSSKLSSKNSRKYSKKYTKSKCVCFNEVINDNENEAKNEKQITYIQHKWD